MATSLLYTKWQVLKFRLGTYVTQRRGPYSTSFGQLTLQNIFFQLTTIVVFRCLSNASSFSTVLENVANLLRVDIYELSDALTQKSMILRGEEILSPLSVEQVCNYKQYIGWGFCDIQNKQGQGNKCWRTRLITLTENLIIPDITKTNLTIISVLLYMVLKKIATEQNYSEHWHYSWK